MLPAPRPFCETQRLWALRSLAILDTPPEAVFERLVSLAARSLKMPMVTISLVDRDRQWFKACVGLNVKETLRDHAICTYTILQDQAFVVPDLAADERFMAHPAVLRHRVRFYAGAPLVLSEGYRVGALCVMDRRPRTLGPEGIATLEDLAATATKLMELRRDALTGAPIPLPAQPTAPASHEPALPAPPRVIAA